MEELKNKIINCLENNNLILNVDFFIKKSVKNKKKEDTVFVYSKKRHWVKKLKEYKRFDVVIGLEELKLFKTLEEIITFQLFITNLKREKGI